MTIRAGVIGLGKMGISHCAILGSHPEVDLICVCDTSSMVIEAFKKYTAFECFSDYKKMIDTMSLDALVIASPTKYHYEMADYALRHNIHVFCEKPFSLDAESGMRLSRLAAESSLINQVGYHNRFIGTFNEVKKLLDYNIIGKPYHFLAESYGPVLVKDKAATWRSEKGEGGGCLYDYASHTIDLINYTLGKPVMVSGTKLNYIFSKDVEDAVYSSLTLENGITGQLSVNWSDETFRKMSTQLTILGKKGKIIVDSSELKIFLKEDNVEIGYTKGWTSKSITELTHHVNFYLRGEEYSEQIDHFIECINRKKISSRSTFESASETDGVINLLLNDISI